MIRTFLNATRSLISLRRREPDNYVDFCASPPSWRISKMLEGRYIRTLLGPAGDAVLSSVWPCDIHCGGPIFAVLRRRASTMQIWFICRASLWHAFAPLSQRVDPQIPSLTELLRALLMLQFIRVISRRDPRRGRRGRRSLQRNRRRSPGEGRKKMREKSERIERSWETNRSAEKPGMEEAAIKAGRVVGGRSRTVKIRTVKRTGERKRRVR